MNVCGSPALSRYVTTAALPSAKSVKRLYAGVAKATNKFEVEAYEKIFTKDVNDIRFAANGNF